MLWIFVVSIASANDMRGITVGMRFASIDLPEPAADHQQIVPAGDGDFDGPFRCCRPRTSAKSTSYA
jgi:hypothetical protein